MFPPLSLSRPLTLLRHLSVHADPHLPPDLFFLFYRLLLSLLLPPSAGALLRQKVPLVCQAHRVVRRSPLLPWTRQLPLAARRLLLLSRVTRHTAALGGRTSSRPVALQAEKRVQRRRRSKPTSPAVGSRGQPAHTPAGSVGPVAQPSAPSPSAAYSNLTCLSSVSCAALLLSLCQSRCRRPPPAACADCAAAQARRCFNVSAWAVHQLSDICR